MDQILEISLEVTVATRGVVYLREEREDRFKLAKGRDAGGEPIRDTMILCRDLTDAVVQRRVPILCQDALEDERYTMQMLAPLLIARI